VDIRKQIEALENLAKVDARLAQLDGELAQEREALGGKRQHLQELEQRLAAAQLSIQEMDRTRHDLMGEARQMSNQLERSRDKLARCRTEREVNAAQRELEELRKLYRDREVEIQKIAGLTEQAEADVAAVTQEREAVMAELGESAGAVETRLNQLESEAAEQRAAREHLVKAVPPVLFRRYDMIRKRRGSGICHTTEGTCSACHISLAPMMFQNLRRGERLEQCPNCNRIIYFKAEPPPPVVEQDA
jgi:uncharacterized protein